MLPLRAFENRVYEIELDDERRLVVKFYRPGRWSRETILDEHAFLADLAAAEIPTVAPIDLGTGSTVAEVDGILLGYNIRPVRLHTIARETMARYGGRLPDDAEALRALPGIGRYTAGAVLSFAYGRDAAVLDTNVRRVLGRVFLGPRRAALIRGEKTFWDLAEALVPAGRAYAFNQALMDFGATWCTPRKPRCPPCPMKSFCGFFVAGAARPAATEGGPSKVRRGDD